MPRSLRRAGRAPFGRCAKRGPPKEKVPSRSREGGEGGGRPDLESGVPVVAAAGAGRQRGQGGPADVPPRGQPQRQGPPGPPGEALAPQRQDPERRRVPVQRHRGEGDAPEKLVLAEAVLVEDRGNQDGAAGKK